MIKCSAPSRAFILYHPKTEGMSKRGSKNNIRATILRKELLNGVIWVWDNQNTHVSEQLFLFSVAPHNTTVLINSHGSNRVPHKALHHSTEL